MLDEGGEGEVRVVCAVAYACISVQNITMYVDAVCAKIHIGIC